MCFYIHPAYKEPKVATEDVNCFKVLRFKKSFFGFFKRDFESPYQYTPYELKTLYTATIRPNFWTNVLVGSAGHIDEGLHSFSSFEKAKEHAVVKNRCVRKAIIPKGASYYYNPEEKEYVSTELIVL